MAMILNILNSEEFFLLLKLLIFGASFASLFLLAMYILPDEKQLAAKRRLGVSEDATRPNRVPLLRWTRLLFTPLVPYAVARVSEEKRKELNRKLVCANLRDELSPEEFFAFKWVLMVLSTFLVIYLFGALLQPLPVPLWPGVLILGYFAADFWLHERTKMRRRSILRALPYTMDLLTLSVEAGLDFIAAIQRLSLRTQPNALMDEFNQLLKEIRLGTARADALRNLSDRLQIEEISSFTTLLIQADQLGASIGHVLRAQSDQLRAKRFQGAEAAGAKASQMVLFPLVLCIFPAIFIVVLGPTILSFLSKGLF